mgnify:CR=1 FL=1
MVMTDLKKNGRSTSAAGRRGDAAQRAAYIEKHKRVVMSKARIKPDELIFFSTQLSIMLESGVVLSEALDSMKERTDSRSSFRPVLEDIANTVKSGEAFSKAISVYPRIFSSMYVSVIRAAEGSGRMSQMLRVLSEYIEFELDVRKRVKGAMIYPFIMIIMTIVTTAILLFFVLPKFTVIYESKGAELPAITQFMLDMSEMVHDFRAMTVFMSVAAAAVGFGVYFSRTQAGRQLIDYIRIKVPVIGTMFVDVLTTRSMRILATMLSAGVNILDTIAVVKGSALNYYFQQLWSEAGSHIEDGYQFSEALTMTVEKTGKARSERSGEQARAVMRAMIDPAVIQMLRAGEKGGRLGEVTDKISCFYEKKLTSSIKAVTSLIEPVMIIIMGLIVGTIAISLLLPVFRISRVIAS